MGTRCITVVTSNWVGQETKQLATIYRHWDGYPDGHGRWLAEFLKDAVVINGRRTADDEDNPNKFNGPGRLASGIVHALVEDGHEPSLDELGAVKGQEFEYHVHVLFCEHGGTISVKVFDGPMTMFGEGGQDCNNEIFHGTVGEFSNFIETYNADDYE